MFCMLNVENSSFILTSVGLSCCVLCIFRKTNDTILGTKYSYKLCHSPIKIKLCSSPIAREYLEL